MQEVPEGRSKVGQRILLLVAEEVGGSGPEPGSQGAREPGSQGARESGSQGAREPESQGAREPGSQGVRQGHHRQRGV